MWVLFLNDMRQRAEDQTPVVRSTSREALEEFVKREIVEPYTDNGAKIYIHDTDFIAQAAGGPVEERLLSYSWRKFFRKGGPLEWFNPPDYRSFRDFLDREEWLRRAAENWESKVGRIPEIY